MAGDRPHDLRELEELLERMAQTGEAEQFRPESIDPLLLDRLVASAAGYLPPRFGQPPWRTLVVVGEERERLTTRVAEALARHWGLGGLGPQGLASEAVLAAPAFVMVFSSAPASEESEVFALVAGMVQSLLLMAHVAGLGTHRIPSVHVVPEAALDYAAEFLGPEVRGGELVSLIAMGWPAEAPGRGRIAQVAPTWVGLSGRTPDPPTVTAYDLRPPARLLRANGRERVLVVDFYPYNRAFIEAQLVRGGYAVDVFSDAESLVTTAQTRGAPDLYIVSDTLPDTTGFELVRHLKQRDALDAPVIITTARRDSAFRISGLAAGVDYYLRKPIHAVELFTAARILLDRHRLVVDLRAANTELGRLLDELRTTQSRLVQHAKMAALGQLVAGVAHEINTPLAAVVSNNDLFLRCFERLRQAFSPLGASTQGVVVRDLDAMEELSLVTRSACARITDIVRTLRTFARLDEAEVKAVDLHEGMESTLVIIAHLLKGGIQVERRYGALPPVECHPNQINQVFMNLLINACQAMGDEGRLTISTRPLGDEVEVQIADSGSGIPKEQLPRIFEPGFTTKGAPLGTGLGLSIVYQIVEGHGGDIRVESEMGQGTAFTLRLPLHHLRGASTSP
jgi:two-component system NtrC family sensor kinase